MAILRDYGFGDIKVVGPPRFKGMTMKLPACPNCGCTHMAEIETDVVDPRLRGGKGIGRYVGCPACPFASPMICVADGAVPPPKEAT